MELLKRTKDKKEKAQLEQPKNISFENAYIIDAKTGDAIRNTLLEFPMKFTQAISPILKALEECTRANLNLAPQVVKNDEE